MKLRALPLRPIFSLCALCGEPGTFFGLRGRIPLDTFGIAHKGWLGAALTGIVRGTAGAPISFAVALFEGTEHSSISDDSGRFHLAGVPPGVHELTVKRIGYEPALITVTLAPDTTITLDIRLRGVQALEEVMVTAERDSRFARTGFYHRQRLGQGTFMTPQRVDSLSHLQSPSLLLRDVPGIKLRCGGFSCDVRPRRPPLCMWLYVDGHAHGTTQLDLVVSMLQVHAIEVYDRPSRVPAEFLGKLPPRRGGLSTAGGCGALVVWTKARAH